MFCCHFLPILWCQTNVPLHLVHFLRQVSISLCRACPPKNLAIVKAIMRIQSLLILQCVTFVSPLWQWEYLHKHCQHAYDVIGLAMIWFTVAYGYSSFSCGKPIFAGWGNKHLYQCASMGKSHRRHRHRIQIKKSVVLKNTETYLVVIGLIIIVWTHLAECSFICKTPTLQV